MVTYDEAVRHLAQKRYDLWRGGANDTRVDVSVVVFIYGKTAEEVDAYVDQIFEMWKVR